MNEEDNVQCSEGVYVRSVSASQLINSPVPLEPDAVGNEVGEVMIYSNRL